MKKPATLLPKDVTGLAGYKPAVLVTEHCIKSDARQTPAAIAPHVKAGDGCPGYTPVVHLEFLQVFKFIKKERPTRRTAAPEGRKLGKLVVGSLLSLVIIP